MEGSLEDIAWCYTTRPLHGWGGQDPAQGHAPAQQRATAGWLAAFPVFEPHWQVCMAGGLSSGWMRLGSPRGALQGRALVRREELGGLLPPQMVLGEERPPCHLGLMDWACKFRHKAERMLYKDHMPCAPPHASRPSALLSAPLLAPYLYACTDWNVPLLAPPLWHFPAREACCERGSAGGGSRSCTATSAFPMGTGLSSDFCGSRGYGALPSPLCSLWLQGCSLCSSLQDLCSRFLAPVLQVQCNAFEGFDGNLSVTAGGGRRKVPWGGGDAGTEDVAMVSSPSLLGGETRAHPSLPLGP